MIPSISIDTMALSEQFMLDRNHIDDLKEAVVSTVTKVVETSWRSHAKKELGSTRNQYMNSIIVGEEGRFANVITLVGELPNMIESGASPWDMKEGFENSDKKVITRNREGKLGWYLTIPFTFAQPSSLGESQKFTGVLPQDVASALKTKQKTNPTATLSLSDIPQEFKIPKMRPAVTLGGGELSPDYTHKNSIYEGISQPTKGGSVMSFRRVSGNSDDNSWVHPGFKAHNLADKAVADANIPEIVGDVIDSFLDQIV